MKLDISTWAKCTAKQLLINLPYVKKKRCMAQFSDFMMIFYTFKEDKPEVETIASCK